MICPSTVCCVYITLDGLEEDVIQVICVGSASAYSF